MSEVLEFLEPDNANVFKRILIWQADAQAQQMDANEDFNAVFRNCMRVRMALAFNQAFRNGQNRLAIKV